MTSGPPQRLVFIYAVVAKRLPEHQFVIRRLIAMDDAFRDMCDEFAEACTALERRSNQPDRKSAESESEWTDIVERLASEILAYVMARQTK